MPRELSTLVPRWTKHFLHTSVFPPVCLLCGGRGHAVDLCAECRAEFPWLRCSCPRCGTPLPSSTLCDPCQRSVPFYDRIFTAFVYEPPIDALIVGLKFRDRIAHARLLGELLADALATRTVPLPDLILPVPLHHTRLRKRGYNQALELTRPVAQRLGMPVDSTVCHRVRATRPQSTLEAEQRRSNVRDAFFITKNSKVAGRRIAILDDVVTTGHTVNELARVLYQAGARGVEVWGVAKAAC